MTQNKKTLSVQEIVDQCGGAMHIAYRLGMVHSAVVRWYRAGIPQKHWAAIQKMGSFSVEDLYNANRAALRQRRKK